ncbi:bacteriohopanetetrol glucosamine biosynthesis glycosyltransferase HpnI [Labrys okinawensis]|uniref:bacteriohopanetetrol glucosamine biosynthesis glycosyltransferase HpnI n=1 Tax=Labrys okinawensis TaxID=346911 RepID=UPI0039BCFAB5
MYILGQIIGVLAALGCLYWLLAAWLVGRFGSRTNAAAHLSSPLVTILKPLHGAEPLLAANLFSFAQQDYAGPIQIIFGVQSLADAAIPDVRALIDALPGQDLSLVVNPQRHGSNPKVSNLINMMLQAKGEVIVLADSDIVVEPDYVRRVVGELQTPGVGAVSCAYRGGRLRTTWSRFAALAIDSHFLPNVVVGLAGKLATPCFGATIALRRETLDRLGGFETFADTLADDYAIGRGVRRLGLQVAVPGFLVTHICAEGTFSDLLKHEIRWAKTIANVDRPGFIGTGLTHVIPLALIAFLLTGRSEWSGILLATSLACRYLLLWSVKRRFDIKEVALWLLVLRDGLSFFVYLASFLPSAVHWKGERFLVKTDGSMIARHESD